MKKLFRNAVIYIIVLVLVGAVGIDAYCIEKTTFYEFRLECEYEHVPGEILVRMMQKTDVREFVASMPELDIEFIYDLMENVRSIPPVTYDSYLSNNTLFRLSLVDKSGTNLYRTAKKLINRVDTTTVSPNHIFHITTTSYDDTDAQNYQP